MKLYQPSPERSWLRPVGYGLAGGAAGCTIAAIALILTGHSRAALCEVVAALVLVAVSAVVDWAVQRADRTEPDPEAGE